MGGSTVGSVAGADVERLLHSLRSESEAPTSLTEVAVSLDPLCQQLTTRKDHARLAELADALASWASRVDGDSEARDALLRASDLAEVAQDADQAVDLCERALRRDPTSSAATERLTTLLTNAGDFARLESARMEQVEQLATHAPLEYELRIGALTALAELRAGELRDLDAAIQAYQEALEIEPLDETLHALAKLHLKRNQAGDRDDAAELYFRLGEHLPPEQARPLLERALDCSPEHEGALVALQELAQVAPEGVDEGRLRERMLQFASVAPASERRDSVIAELREMGSEVPDFEAPPLPQVASASWDRVPAHSPVTAVHSSRTASSAIESAAKTSGAGGVWPPPDSQGPVPSPPNPTARPRGASHNVLAWAGAGGLAALIALAGFGLLGSEERESASVVEANRSGESEASTARSAQAPAAGNPPEREAPARPRSEAPARRKQRARRSPVTAEKPAGDRAKRPGGVLVAPLVKLGPGMDDREAVMQPLSRVEKRVTRCYARARRRSAQLQGLVEYAWTVRPNGRVLKVRALSDSLHAPGVRNCGITAIRKQRFPRHAGKRPVELRAVFDYNPPAR